MKDYDDDLHCVPIKCDNTSAINLVLHSKIVHIEIKLDFLRDHVSIAGCLLEFSGTTKQVADIFTKLLLKHQFYKLQNELGMLCENEIP